MKKGLNLLNRRNSKKTLDGEFFSLKQIPDSFKIFISQYELGYAMLNISKVKVNNNLDFFVEIKMFENEVIHNEEYSATIDYILDLPELFFEYENYKKEIDYWNKLGFMKIGFLFHGDVILLGLADNVFGEIWRFGNGLINTKYCKLDNNIFDFFSRLNEKVDLEQLNFLNIKLNDLYRNWGEDFWRVKGDEGELN